MQETQGPEANGTVRSIQQAFQRITSELFKTLRRFVCNEAHS